VEQGISIDFQVIGDWLEITLERAEDWSIAADAAISTALNALTVKKEALRAPKINRNDRSYVFMRLVNSLTKDSSYIDGFAEVLQKLHSKFMNPREVSEELGNVEFGKGELRLGGPLAKYPVLQLFKVELYEKGLTYHKPYTLEYSIKCSESWLTMQAIGFAYSYAGSYGGKVTFITVKEEYRSYPTYDLALVLASTLARLEPDPIIPYIMTLSLKLPDMIKRRVLEEAGIKGLEDILLSSEEASDLSRKIMEGRYVPSIGLHTLSVGRAFTALSRLTIDLTVPMKFAYLLDAKEDGTACRNTLGRLLARALGAGEPVLINASTLLYEALNRAKDFNYVLYVLLRTVRELRERGRLRRDEELSRKCVWCLREAFEEL